MRGPYEKYIRMELLSLGLAAVIGVVAIMQGYVAIMLFCMYLVACSIFCEGLLQINTNRTADGIKQFIKGGMLLLLATALLFAL